MYVKDVIKSLAYQMIPDVMSTLLHIKDQIRHAHQLRVACITWMRQNKKNTSPKYMFQELCVRLKNVNERKNPSPGEIFE